MNIVQKTFLAVAILMLASVSAQAASRVEFILDVSGSMNALAGGEKKIAAAQKAIAAAVQTIPDGSVVALRLYGHRVPNANKAESCKDSELVIPFAPIVKQQFLAAVNQAKPLGQTPIAFSLEQAAKDFGASKDEETVIILVSDGEETCGGDPAAVAKNLIAQGFKVTIHTIGFDVDAKTRAQLQAVSQATGGQYRDAKDTAGLADSLKKFTQESLVIQKEKSVYGEPIRGGDSYETAVALKPGELHRLDHHQKKNDFDYFYIDLTGGQKLTAKLNTGEKGVSIREGKATENANPYAGIQIHNSGRQRVMYDTIIGSHNAKKELWLNLGDAHGGRYYILVGNTYDDQNKDNPFMIEVEDRFDAGSGKDAGEKEAGAIAIQPGNYTGHMGPGDGIDMYKFTATPGGKYNFKARASSDRMRFRTIIIDSDGVKFVTKDSPNRGAAVKVEGFETPNGGDFFIRLSSYHSDIPLTDYKMTLATGKGVAEQPAPAPAVSQPEAALPPPPAVAPTGEVSSSPFAGLSFWGRLKFYLMYSGIPLGVGLFIGLIGGYLIGRKRK